MTYAPPALVVGAARLPLPFGLFSTFTLRGPSGGDRWPLGVQWETGTCDPVDGIGDVECGQPEIQRITIGGGPSTGTWTAAYGSPPQETDPLAIDALASQVEAALKEIVPGGVSVSGPTGGPYTVTFTGNGDHPDLALANTFDTGLMTLVHVQQGDLEAGPNIGLPKDLASNSGRLGVATPFTVYGHFTCSPVGYPLAAAQDLATTHLLAREERRVEQAFWTCDLGNIPGLACSQPTDLTAGVGDPVCYGIGALEQFIATNYGNLGVIHMTRATALAAIAAECVTSTGGRLFTTLGTPVAAGGGYPGTGPLGEPAVPGAAWMYATPALFGYRSEVFTSTAVPGDRFDRGNNDLMAVAERTYLLGYDPCGTATILVKYADITEGPS